MMSIIRVAGALAFVAAVPVQAQRYQLRLAPQAGDTLRMQLEQQTEVSGGARADAPARTMKSRYRVLSSAVVTARAADGTSLVATTDSVSVESDDPHARGMVDQVRRMLAGQEVRLRLAPDGTVRVVDQAGNEVAGSSQSVSLIPAALPQMPLAIGETWVRTMPLPVGPLMSAGLVRATFRLDSLSKGGRIAHVSVRGDVAREPAPAAGPRGTVMKVVGTVAGTLQLDRIRGWIADSRFVVTMHSALEPPAASGVAPVKFTTIVTQRMHLRPRTAPRAGGDR